MARPISKVDLSETERQELESRVKASTASQRDSLRAAIILRRAEGIKQAQVAQELGVSVACVNKWSQRFQRDGLDGLQDAKGRGRPPSRAAEKIEQVITRATQPPKPRTRWTVRTMAQAVGMSPDSVHRIWQANDIKPHLVNTFKVSKDKRFEEKFWDVIGLYLDPPEKALVLCCDEKCQCQALERSQPGLPLGVGELRTKTHDYKRHGTITLFAASYLPTAALVSAKTEERSQPTVEWPLFETDRPGNSEGRWGCTGSEPTARQRRARVGQWLSRHAENSHLPSSMPSSTSSSWCKPDRTRPSGN